MKYCLYKELEWKYLHLYVATFQQHLGMEYILLILSDIQRV